MDKKNIIIGILILIILSGGLVYSYNYIENKAYNLGVQDTVILINSQLLNSLNQNGYIPYMYPINETDFINIKLVPQLDKE